MNLSVSGIMVQKFWDNRFLLRCFSICWCTALFMSHHSISVWLISGLWDWAIVTPWPWPFLLQSFCCTLAAVLWIIVLLNEPLSVKLLAVWQMTSHLTLGSKCHWRPRACSQIITPPLPCFGSFMWYVVSVLPDVAFQPILDGSRPTCAKHAYSYSQFSAWFCQYSCCLILSFWVYCVWTDLNGAAKSAWFRF